MSLSRLFLPLFFVLALLSAQQGSAAHAYAHWFAEEAAQDKQAPHSPACEKCASYAQLGGLLHSTEHVPALDEFAEAQNAGSAAPHLTHFACATPARGPPPALQQNA